VLWSGKWALIAICTMKKNAGFIQSMITQDATRIFLQYSENYITERYFSCFIN